MEAVIDDDNNLYRKCTNENEYLHSTKGTFDRFGIHLRQKYMSFISFLYSSQRKPFIIAMN